MPDCWKSYETYGCQHRVCGAHLVRDCPYVGEQDQQEWAAQQWRQRGALALPRDERDEWVAQ